MGIFNLFDLFGGATTEHGFVSLETERRIKSDWEKINSYMVTRQPSQLRQALIMADRSLDTALKEIVTGENMGERLRNMKNRVDRDTYGRIWEAHKIRNNLVHEADYDPPYFVVGDAINNLKNALLKLHVNLK